MRSEDRSTSFRDPDVQKCDTYLTPGWYRFSLQAGEHMPTKCVPKFSCGTYAPGWLEGEHPTVAEGVVQRRVCFHSERDCCENAVLVRVKNCGDFYVYRLVALPSCPFRYCGAKTKVSSNGQGWYGIMYVNIYFISHKLSCLKTGYYNNYNYIITIV